MFRLSRYFSIASLIAFVLVTLLLAALYRSVALRMFIELEENKNVELTQSFANSIWPELQPLIALTEASTHVDLRTNPFIGDLRQAVITQMKGLAVIKVKIYDLDGHTIFSTQIDQIGEDNSSNAGFQRAMLGEVASELTHRDTFSTFEETIEDQDVLSTYIPIHANDKVVGVFELYSNVTPFLWQINRTQRLLVSGVSITLAFLYVVLLWIVSRADRIMRQQHQEQLASAEEIRRQQRTVAVLQDREHVAREIHDSLGQVLGYVNTQAQAARSLLNKEKYDATDTLLQRLVVVAQDSHVELRDFILKLQTGDVNSQPLIPHLRYYMKQFQSHTDIETALDVAPEFDRLILTAAVELQLFRIVQEALNNIQKHAAATEVTIRATVEKITNTADLAAVQVAQISIADNGKGFDYNNASGNYRVSYTSVDTTPAQHDRHWGLSNMQARATEIGASLQVHSTIGSGTTVIVQLPLATESFDHSRHPKHVSQSRPRLWRIFSQSPARSS